MIFGDRVQVPASGSAAEWIGAQCRGRWWTVGWFVPNDYETYVRVRAPGPDLEDWWAAYRALFEAVATVGSRHTATPDRAWFAVWEGYGWDTSTSHVAAQGPLDDAARRALREEQARLREEDTRRHAMVRAGLADVPRFELPNRTYHLLAGPVAAVTEIEVPGSPGRWQRPDLFWPDDHSWFVATDVDFWSLYIGGDPRFIVELTDVVPTRADFVTPEHPLESED
jgi:hypothetical protein